MPEAPTPRPARAPRSVPRTERPIQTVGRRKEAIVRVRIDPRHRQVHLQRPRPLRRTSRARCTSSSSASRWSSPSSAETLDVIANLRGGGITGQAGALRLAIARALIASSTSTTARP